MSELKEREQLKSKAIEDMDFLKSKEIEIRTILRSYFSDIQAFAPIDAALNTVTISNTNYLDTGSIENLRNFYANFLNRFTIAARAFLHNQSNKNTQNELIESAKAFNEFVKIITNENEKKETINNKWDSKISSSGVDISQKIDSLAKRIENIENKPDEIIEALNNNLNRSEKMITTSTELSQKSQEFLQEITQLKQKAQEQSEKILEDILDFKQKAEEQNEKLVTKLENTINQKISVVLSDQFEKKSSSLKIGTNGRFRLFIMTIGMLFVFNVLLFITYFDTIQNLPDVLNDLNTSTLPLASKFSSAISKLAFWDFMMLKLTMNIPFLILIGFLLNEYTKSKKLYEEYEFRKILAITLFNNYERLTKDLGMEKEDLMESLKSSLDKIFDNPVHSIYGDKSGDKNIGLDQLEKFASVFEKIKK